MPTAKYQNHQGSGPTLLEDVLRLQGNFRRALLPMGVTPLQAGVLCYLHRHEGAQLGNVAVSLSVQPPTLVAVVKRKLPCQ
jgi:DNA-binding MarR family transcriptional regulator